MYLLLNVLGLIFCMTTLCWMPVINAQVELGNGHFPYLVLMNSTVKYGNRTYNARTQINWPGMHPKLIFTPLQKDGNSSNDTIADVLSLGRVFFGNSSMNFTDYDASNVEDQWNVTLGNTTDLTVLNFTRALPSSFMLTISYTLFHRDLNYTIPNTEIIYQANPNELKFSFYFWALPESPFIDSLGDFNIAVTGTVVGNQTITNFGSLPSNE